MIVVNKHPLRIFLCHSSQDKPAVRLLYKRLKSDGFDVWLDEEDLLPGQDWEAEITQAVRSSHIVIICLSRTSIHKSGYVQKEIRFTLNIAEEKPDGVIFIIPARLEECEVPEKIKRWQWVDLYKDDGYNRLLLSLKANLSQLDKTNEYADDIGTRIQSGLAKSSPPHLAIDPKEIKESIGQESRLITILLRSTGDQERDKWRIKTIYSTLISFSGKDRFSFQVFDGDKSHLIDFPNNTTRISHELLSRLNILLVPDTDLWIERIVQL